MAHKDWLEQVDAVLDAEDLELDRKQLDQLALIRRMIRQEGALIMASLDNLTAAVAELDQDVHAAADAVSAKIAELQAEIDGLTVGQITQEQIDSLTDKVNAVDTAVDELDASVSPSSPTDGEPGPEPAPEA